MSDPFHLSCAGRALDCRPGRFHVMGVLNITPDSFSDGGAFTDPARALARAEEMVSEGASLIDVGGASSRPKGSVYGEGADLVPPDVERNRVVPVVRAIVKAFPDVIVSVDTFQPDVARAALDAGAHLINDITALSDGPDLAVLAAEAGAALVLMHAVGRPGAMAHEARFGEDVVHEVASVLRRAADIAREAGVASIVLDPGFGFGKSPEDNLRLINRLDAIVSLGRPVLVGISRKSTIGQMLGSADAPAPVHQRLFGTLGATAVALLRGASIIRTHDVRPTIELARLVHATAATEPSFRIMEPNRLPLP